MVRRLPALKILWRLGLMLLSQVCTAQTDSLVDCFPLSIGNQWQYRFEHVRWDDLDPGTLTKTDTGTAVYTIVGRTVYADSVVWIFAVERVHHKWAVHQVGPTDTTIYDSTVVDSTTFSLVEALSSRHELYRQLSGDPYDLLDYDAGIMWNSAVPFQRNLPDSARMYRYHVGDSALAASFTLKYEMLGCHLDIEVKKDSGLISLHAQSVIALWNEYAHYSQLSAVVTEVMDDYQDNIPVNIVLLQNYPNPFNPATTITYELPRTADVVLSIYDVRGSLVARSLSTQQAPGRYYYLFDASDLSSGVYFCRLRVGSHDATIKLALLR